MEILAVAHGHKQAFHLPGAFLRQEIKGGGIAQLLLGGVGNLVGYQLRVKILLGLGFRHGVAQVIQVLGADLRVDQEVDKGFCSFLLLGAGGDADAVYKDVVALLLRAEEPEVGVLFSIDNWILQARFYAGVTSAVRLDYTLADRLCFYFEPRLSYVPYTLRNLTGNRPSTSINRFGSIARLNMGLRITL